MTAEIGGNPTLLVDEQRKCIVFQMETKIEKILRILFLKILPILFDIAVT